MFIPLVKIEKELNEEAQEKIKDMHVEAANLSKEISKDIPPKKGTYEYYVNLGVPPPDHLKPKNIPTSLEITFHIDKDYDTYYSDILANTDEIEEIETWQEKKEYSIIYYKSGREITVQESLEEIRTLIIKNQ